MRTVHAMKCKQLMKSSGDPEDEEFSEFEDHGQQNWRNVKIIKIENKSDPDPSFIDSGIEDSELNHNQINEDNKEPLVKVQALDNIKDNVNNNVIKQHGEDIKESLVKESEEDDKVINKPNDNKDKNGIIEHNEIPVKMNIGKIVRNGSIEDKKELLNSTRCRSAASTRAHARTHTLVSCR